VKKESIECENTHTLSRTHTHTLPFLYKNDITLLILLITPLLPTPLSSMSFIEKEAYVEMLEEKVRKTIVAIAHFNQCVLIELAATSALNQFRERYSYSTIHNDPLLQEEESRLVKAKTKAWNDRFAAEGAAYPPTLERVLGSVAMAGYTAEVAPLMNLTKETRICKLLQPVMREVRNK